MDDTLPTSQYQQLNQMTMQNIQTILCIGCTDFGAMTMLVMASYWPEKQFVVADDNQDVINAWQYQDLPVFEPELQILLAQRRNANLRFSNCIGEEINEARIIFVAPDVQTKRNGEGMGGCLDFAKWKEVMRMILNGATEAKFIVDMSCFPLEDLAFFKNFIRESFCNNNLATSHHIFSNPCFFSPGTIIADLRNPTQVIIAARSKSPNSNLLVELYEKWVSPGRIFINISPQTTAIGKIACNVIQAMNIASINCFTLLCDEFGADITEVEGIISRDRRIDRTEIKHNAGISGPELQRDVQYSAYLAGNRAFECHSKLFKNTIETNKRFKELIVKKMIRNLTSLQDTTIVVMGFSCKPNTSNIRDSPALYICEKLVVEGARVRIYDPRVPHQVTGKCFRPGLRTSIRVIQQPDRDTLWNQSHAILFLQSWEEFNHIDFHDVFAGMVKPAYIFDACNCNLEYDVMRDIGFQIRFIGRPNKPLNAEGAN